jgi:hypothetical protein
MECVEKGTLIRDFGHKRTYYMKTDSTVGACCGELTEFVFAEENKGRVHGRPISLAALKKLGVKL